MFLAAGLLAPPAAAFGVTFALGHSLRHLVRLADLRGGAPPLPPGSALRGALVAGWPLALAALAATAAVATGAARWQTAVLGGLLALTVPHAAVVAAADRAVSRQAAPCPAGRRG